MASSVIGSGMAVYSGYSMVVVCHYVCNWSQVSDAKDLCDMAHDDAEMAFERAQFAKNQSQTVRIELEELIIAITEFLEQNGASPEDIRSVCTLLDRLYLLRMCGKPKYCLDSVFKNGPSKTLTSVQTVF